jgi:hypothetical protein
VSCRKNEKTRHHFSVRTDPALVDVGLFGFLLLFCAKLDKLRLARGGFTFPCDVFQKKVVPTSDFRIKRLLK